MHPALAWRAACQSLGNLRDSGVPHRDCASRETEAQKGEVTCPKPLSGWWQSWGWSWLPACTLAPHFAHLGLEEASTHQSCPDRKTGLQRHRNLPIVTPHISAEDQSGPGVLIPILGSGVL